jgi:hypothetical protein
VTDAVQIAVITGCTAVIVGFLQRNHNAVNGRMTQLIDETRKASRAQGHEEGVKDQKENPS